jgi:hypothetical protein
MLPLENLAEKIAGMRQEVSEAPLQAFCSPPAQHGKTLSLI